MQSYVFVLRKNQFGSIHVILRPWIMSSAKKTHIKMRHLEVKYVNLKLQLVHAFWNNYILFLNNRCPKVTLLLYLLFMAVAKKMRLIEGMGIPPKL